MVRGRHHDGIDALLLEQLPPVRVPFCPFKLVRGSRETFFVDIANGDDFIPGSEFHHVGPAFPTHADTGDRDFPIRFSRR